LDFSQNSLQPSKTCCSVLISWPTSEVCICFYFSCDYSTWWEFDLVYIDSCQAAKSIIIPSKTLVKLQESTSKTNTWNKFVIMKQNYSFSVNTDYWNINWNMELKHKLTHKLKHRLKHRFKTQFKTRFLIRSLYSI